MKKIFTVLLAVSSFTIANAQYHNSNNDYGKNDSRNSNYERNDDKRYSDAYSFSSRDRDEQISRINSMYNSKIRAINMDRYLKANKKRKEVAKVEAERSQRIREINAKFLDKRNRFSNTYAYGGNNRY